MNKKQDDHQMAVDVDNENDKDIEVEEEDDNEGKTYHLELKHPLYDGRYFKVVTRRGTGGSKLKVKCQLCRSTSSAEINVTSNLRTHIQVSRYLLVSYE